jgi:hypothetical protein
MEKNEDSLVELFTLGETRVLLRAQPASDAELEAHKARLSRGQYVLIPDFAARVLIVAPYRDKALRSESLEAEVSDALTQRPHWVRRFAPASAGTTAIGLPSLATRSPLACLAIVGGVRRLAQYAQHLTLFHPTMVPWYAARMAQSLLGPQPAWLAGRPPHRVLRQPSAEADALIVWEQARAPPHLTPPGPRVTRFPPTLYGDKPEVRAKLVTVLAFPAYEGCALVGDGDVEQAGLFEALLQFLFPDELPVLEGDDAKPHQLFALGYALALTGREPTSTRYTDEKGKGVTDSLCLYVSETLASLQMRKTPFYA